MPDTLWYWRTGRKVGRTVYAQVRESGPSDSDVLIGMMDTPELAEAACNGHNAVVTARANDGGQATTVNEADIPNLWAENKRLRLIFSVIDLPYVLISKYEHKSHYRSGEWTGYAAVIKGTCDSYDNWCHPVVDEVAPWHRSEDEAWACFDTNHPGMREALAIGERSDDGEKVIP